jgi:hypothetical protein
MSRLLLPLVFLLAVAFTPLRAQSALRPGEAPTYRVGSRLISNAGEIKIVSANPPLEAAPQPFLTVTTTSTRGLARAFLTFDARAEAQFNAGRGQLQSNIETTTTLTKNTRNRFEVEFQFGSGVATLISDQPPSTPTTDAPHPHS